MAFTDTGTRGEPAVASAGNTPDFAADLSGISTFFAARSFRHIDTVAHVLSATGMQSQDYAIAANAPGLMFFYDGTAWNMIGEARYASAAARSAAIAAPPTGMKSKRADCNYSEYYDGATWRPIPAMVQIVPSVVAGSGVSVNSQTGKMSIVGASTLSATVFSSAFTNYKIIARATVAATAGDPTLRLRAGSTDTIVDYVYSKLQTNAGTTTPTNTPTTGFDVGRVTTTAAGWFDLELIGPQLAFKTGLANGTGADDAFFSTFQGLQTDSTQFDGFTIIWPGNVTADVWVYGYNN